MRWWPRCRLIPVRLGSEASARVSAVSDTPTTPEIPDIGDVPAVEVVLTVAMHLMTASAVACGLAEDEGGAPREADLAEARILINALAALVTASAPDLGSMHAAPLRDGLTAVQRAFREASEIPDAPGEGPGEKWTGPIY